MLKDILPKIFSELALFWFACYINNQIALSGVLFLLCVLSRSFVFKNCQWEVRHSLCMLSSTDSVCLFVRFNFDDSLKAFAISYGCECLSWTKKGCLSVLGKRVMLSTLGCKLLMVSLKQLWDHPDRPRRDFWNHSQDADALMRPTMLNPAEWELITYDWMNKWGMMVGFV